MNWIDFKKEKPKTEPPRKIKVKQACGSASTIWFSKHFVPDNLHITHWAEIEPPAKPEPDPFEWLTAWRKYRPPGWNLVDQQYFQAGWDAAIKYAKEGK